MCDWSGGFCYSPCIALADCRHKNLLDFLLIRAYFNRGRNELIWLLCGKCNESRSKSQQVYEKIIYLNLWLMKKAVLRVLIKSYWNNIKRAFLSFLGCAQYTQNLHGRQSNVIWRHSSVVVVNFEHLVACSFVILIVYFYPITPRIQKMVKRKKILQCLLQVF